MYFYRDKIIRVDEKKGKNVSTSLFSYLKCLYFKANSLGEGTMNLLGERIIKEVQTI